MQSIFKKLIPFIFLGIMIVLFVVGLIVLSYLLIFGAIVGVILFIIAWIRDQLFNKRQKIQYPEVKKKSNRTIDHDNP